MFCRIFTDSKFLEPQTEETTMSLKFSSKHSLTQIQVISEPYTTIFIFFIALYTHSTYPYMYKISYRPGANPILDAKYRSDCALSSHFRIGMGLFACIANCACLILRVDTDCCFVHRSTQCTLVW